MEAQQMTEALVVDRLQRVADRVRDHSPQHVNRRIARDIDIRVQHCIREGREAILERLAELDREWDIDRVLMANFAIAGGITYVAGLHRFADRPRWRERRTGLLYVLGAQLGFLLLHASVGWCPPMVAWRRLGKRTKSEIELERGLLLAALEPRLPTETKHAPPESQPPKSSQAVS
jgi:hypothetical protein